MRSQNRAALAGLVSVTLLMGLLAGCSPKDEPQAEATPAPAGSPSGETQADNAAPAAPNTAVESASGIDPSKAGKSEVRQAN